MDALLLAVQIVLVILLVVIPLFSGYDKWQGWSGRRRLTALILGAGIGVVAFSQYRRIVFLRKTGLQYVVGMAEHGTMAWYRRPIVVHPYEYLASLVVCGALLGFSFEALGRRRWKQGIGYFVLFAAIVAVMLALKLRWWRG
jgi:hypothetical protein